MKPNQIASNNFFQVLKEEFTKAEGYNKYLLLAIVGNIPLAWIPYATQAYTIILVGIYLKYYPSNNHGLRGSPNRY